MGHPAEGYPFDWSVYQWLPGENANAGMGDLSRAAADLARFIAALRRVDTAGAPPRSPLGRGGPLAEHDERVRQAVAALGDRVDGDAVRRRAWSGRHRTRLLRCLSCRPGKVP
jgi:aminoglycoside phosphotransferase (APT) family kinase protein